MSFIKQFMEAPFLKKAMYAVLAVMVVLNFFISSLSFEIPEKSISLSLASFGAASPMASMPSAANLMPEPIAIAASPKSNNAPPRAAKKATPSHATG